MRLLYHIHSVSAFGTFRNELFVILTYHTAKSQRGNADAFGIFSPFLPKPPAFPIPLRRTSLSVKSRQKRKNGFDAFLVSKEHKAQTPEPPNQNNGEMTKQKIGNGHGPARPRRKRKELKRFSRHDQNDFMQHIDAHRRRTQCRNRRKLRTKRKHTINGKQDKNRSCNSALLQS